MGANLPCLRRAIYHEKAKDTIREYVAELTMHVRTLLGVDPILYVSDSCRIKMDDMVFKLSFHITMANIVFREPDLRDRRMWTLFQTPNVVKGFDSQVYRSFGQMRPIGHSKKSDPTAPLMLDYSLSSPSVRQGHITHSLITYMPPGETYVDITIDPVTKLSAFAGLEAVLQPKPSSCTGGREISISRVVCQGEVPPPFREYAVEFHALCQQASFLSLCLRY